MASTVPVADGALEIGVTDFDPESLPLVRPQEDEILSEGRRGLFLVEQLSEEWGVVGLKEGKQVWFRLSTNDWSFNSTCPCHGDDLDRVRLESGRYAVAVAGAWDD